MRHPCRYAPEERYLLSALRCASLGALGVSMHSPGCTTSTLEFVVKSKNLEGSRGWCRQELWGQSSWLVSVFVRMELRPKTGTPHRVGLGTSRGVPQALYSLTSSREARQKRVTSRQNNPGGFLAVGRRSPHPPGRAGCMNSLVSVLVKQNTSPA